MPRLTSLSRRCPLAAFELEVQARRGRGEISPDDALRWRWMAQETRRDSPSASPLLRAVQAAALRTVVRCETADPDLLTLTRALDSLIRSMRALGMLRPGGQAPAGRRTVPTAVKEPAPTAVKEPALEAEDDDAA
jgi:hypothetical protein